MGTSSGRNYSTDELKRHMGPHTPCSLKHNLACKTQVADLFRRARTRIVGLIACSVLATAAVTAPTAADNAPPAAGAPNAQGSAGVHDSEEIAMFIRRAEEFLKSGDVAAARVLLRRIAEAGDARAALALGSTYDPHMLQPLLGRGILPDVSMACAWYEKATEFGSTEARARIDFWESDSRTACGKPEDGWGAVVPQPSPNVRWRLDVW